ncbi:MAG: DNA polymerase III subunit delta [Idiomarina sp.]|nr:DNA polymerase III subunit delta [Idiomarina sp.]
MQVYSNQLAQHLQGPLQPLYLVFGDDDFLRLRALRQIRQRASQLGFDERLQFNQQQDFSWDELATSAQNLSLFSQLRSIEIELPTASPGQDGAKALQAWLDNPPADTLLILHGPKLKPEQQRSKWFKGLTEYGVFVPVYTPDNAQFGRFIHQLAAEYQLELAPDAVQLLQQWFEGNLLALDQSLQKIALSQSHTQHSAQRVPVSLELVEQHAQQQSRFDIFALQDPLLNGQIELFIQRLQRLLETDAEPVLIHWLLQRHCTILQQAKQLVANGQSPAQAIQKQGVWKNHQSLYLRHLQAWDDSRYAKASALLWRCELAIKRDSKEDLATLFCHLAIVYQLADSPLQVADAITRADIQSLVLPLEAAV